MTGHSKDNRAQRLPSAILAVLLAFVLLTALLAGCEGERLIGGAEMPEYTDEEYFDYLMDEIFIDYVTSDSITLNYSFAYPEDYDIERPARGTYGELPTIETIRESMQETADYAAILEEYNYMALRDDQQIVYDILMREVKLSEAMERSEDCFYYLGIFYPTAGLHVQLPIILAEFRFYTQEDVETYLELLEDTRRYFDGCIDFERERSARGFFLSASNTDEVIDQCESFLSNTDDNLLIDTFDARIDAFDELSVGERQQYKQRNKELVLGSVLPAYEALLEAMRELRGKGAHDGGLATLPGGEEYAKAYLQYQTGSDRTPAEVERLFEKWMDRLMNDLSELIFSNDAYYDSYIGGTLRSIGGDTAENQLISLQKAIARDFPSMNPTRYVVNVVHESLQPFISPAFYLTPALDYYDDNVIYINPGAGVDELGIFTTLAHEGYPGHLYQTVYFLQTEPHPIRTTMEPLGYSEGWATYAEMASYLYAGLGEDEALISQYSDTYDMLLMSVIDLGINCLGWDYDDTAQYLAQFEITDNDVVDEVYQAFTGYPLQYLPYSLGYLEIMELREKAQKTLGESFDLLEFHRFILDFGPAPFSLIREHMEDWIKNSR